MPLAVWANSPDVPTHVCTNARLGGAATQPANRDGQTNGQGGWDVGLQFLSATDLAGQLSQLLISLPPHMCTTTPGLWSMSGCGSASCPGVGPVTRLAVNAHGLPGRLYLAGAPIGSRDTDAQREGQALSAANLGNMSADLTRIYKATAPDATILLMGCLAGQGKAGDDLLKALSGLWQNRTIVAFTTTGYSYGAKMLRGGSGNQCMEPGMRDTPYVHSGPLEGQQDDEKKRWNDLRFLPWASETSPSAKVILNGQFLRRPELDMP